MSGDEKWYAVYTRSHHEQKVYDGLVDKTIEAFLPKYETMSRRRDRRKKIWLPLFPGYLFVHIPWDLKTYWDIIKTDGVVKILMVGPNLPAPVPDEEISSIRIVVESLLPLSPHPFIREGDRVRIIAGPLKGAQGILISRQGKEGKLVVGVELLNRAVSVTIDPEFVQKI
jgi:transcription antitermination factor NusG